MARSSLLSDELVQQLVDVNQVDIVVGLPTFNNAAHIESIVTMVHVGLARHFPRERTVLINADGGSDDGTRERVREAPMAPAELAGSSTLRTTHRVTTSHSGLPGRADGVRLVFAAADLLQARAVAMIDANVTSLTPAWVAELIRPVWKGEFDVVLPVYPRSRYEGPLVGQLVRPLLGTAFGRRLHSNMAGDFGCTGKFAAQLVKHPMWDSDTTRPAFSVRLVAMALADDLRLAEAHLGARVFAPNVARDPIGALFGQVVGSAFASLDRHAAVWSERTAMQDVPELGQAHAFIGDERVMDLSPMAERFRTGVADLAPVLREILRPETAARLTAAGADTAIPKLSDALWVTTVYEFAASAHRGVMNREHLTQALVPIYLGRTASFFSEIASADEATYVRRFAEIEREFEEQRPQFVELWHADNRR